MITSEQNNISSLEYALYESVSESLSEKSLLSQEGTCSKLPGTLLDDLPAPENSEGTAGMAALLCRLARPRCSSRRWLGAILREKHGRAPPLMLRDGAGLLAGGGRSLTAYIRAHSRGQHTEAAGPVEVDLKRLEGEDDGRDTRTWCVSTLLVSHTDKHTHLSHPSDTSAY